jgi:hypothetical protein
VRAEFLSQTILSPDLLGPRGLSLYGARVEGQFDLSSCSIDRPIAFEGSTFDHALNLIAFETPSLAFVDCDLPGITADVARTAHGIWLERCRLTGAALLVDSKIGGVICIGTRFSGSSTALDAGGAEIRGNIDLTDVESEGTIRAASAKVGGGIVCHRARIEPPEGFALVLDGARIEGSVQLTDGFCALGPVRLVRSQIHGSVMITDAEIEGEGLALNATGSTTGGFLHLLHSDVRGGISLIRAQAAGIVDDLGDSETHLGSWARARPLRMTGFDYKQFAGGATWDTASRCRWLRSTDEYDPDAWGRLVAVYRAAGREDEARRIAIAGENDRLARGNLSRFRWLGRWFLRIAIGHGYRPWRAAIWAALVVGLFAAAVWVHSENFRPEKEGVRGDPQALVYAADVFLPIVDLNEGANWLATGHVRWAEWTTIVLGWLLTTVFVAGFTRIVRT